jgi:integrase/recombinase XerD
MTAPTFQSVLAPAIRSCIELRQSLGYQDRGVRTLLAHFDRYVVGTGHRNPWLTRDLVDPWIAGGVALKPHSRATRRHAIRVLGRHIAQTCPDTYVPPLVFGPRHTSDFRPHIYTPAEIQALVAEAGRLTPVGSLRPLTFVTLIGLLYCTGMRIAEALALRLADVDLDDGVLLIRQGKFHKSRIVPVPPDVTRTLARYADARRQHRHRIDPDAAFFVNEWHRPCGYPRVVATFLDIVRRVGIRAAPGQRGPRLHDIRHTFAVYRLLAWYRDGGDVQARLPLLSTYLGHICLVSTQVYLDMTAELLQEAACRFQAPSLPMATSESGRS